MLITSALIFQHLFFVESRPQLAITMVRDHDYLIDKKRSVSKLVPPRSLELKHTVKGTRYSSVYSYEGITYAGREGGIDRIKESDYTVTELFIKTKGATMGLSVSNGRLNVESFDGVDIYNMGGSLANKWDVSQMKQGGSTYAVVDDKVVAVDYNQSDVTLYSLEGGIIRTVSTGRKFIGNFAACGFKTDSVIISCCEGSSVSRVNIDTGKVMWNWVCWDAPGAVTVYGEDYVLVMPKKSAEAEVFVLDSRTG